MFALTESAPPASESARFRRAEPPMDALLVLPTARVEPRWVDAGPDRLELVLVRSLPTDEGPVTEGVTLDWPALRGALEASLADLIPDAALVPASGAAAEQIERDGRGFRLATVPALLVPGDFTPVVPFRMTPALWALVITWLATVGALAAVGMVLLATVRLSDRRAKFVGAVTHELRTPLTTFRLYAQMLAGGMVTDEKARAEYLGTLERESVRLAEIVENVLEYARLTRRRPGAARPPGERSISASELLARVRPVVSRRAEQSGMDLIVSVEPGLDGHGAAGRSGWAALWAARLSVICASHSSSCASGRAFSAGKEPTMPALHCASTSGGCEMMKRGDPTTGMRRFFFRISGKAMMSLTPAGFDVRVNVNTRRRTHRQGGADPDVVGPCRNSVAV
jgi:signal transduction histidine kinase